MVEAISWLSCLLEVTIELYQSDIREKEVHDHTVYDSWMQISEVEWETTFSPVHLKSMWNL